MSKVYLKAPFNTVPTQDEATADYQKPVEVSVKQLRSAVAEQRADGMWVISLDKIE